MPAYIRKYRVYPTADPKKAQAVRTMSTDAEHFTAGHGVQFYLQYLLSDREQYTDCPFQRPALRVLSPPGDVCPGEELQARLFPSPCAFLSFINRIKIAAPHREKGKQVGNAR